MLSHSQSGIYVDHTELTNKSFVQHGTEEKDPRDVPGLQISVSAKVYHDDGTKTYETYTDVVQEILRNASATANS
jgi:hypothetical protein